jgi:hypothetical protein
MYTTTFPPKVLAQMKGKVVLVVKNSMDFALLEPEFDTVAQHLEWFHSFWWETNDDTRPKAIAFFDTSEEAIEAGLKTEGHWNWAVYSEDGKLVDGCY